MNLKALRCNGFWHVARFDSSVHAREAANLLGRASDLVTDAGDPPVSLYWYTKPFLRMNIGLPQHSIGRHHDAVDSLASGMEGLPDDQRNSEWIDEYQWALDRSSAEVNVESADSRS